MALILNIKQVKLVWNEPISIERKRRVFVYNSLEALVFISLFAAHLFLSKVAIFVSVTYLILALDAVLFLVVNGKQFRVGLSSKAILVADREVILIYLAGLRQVSISQQTVYFDYTNDLQLSFPTDCLLAEEKELFFENLSSLVDKNKVLFRNVTTS